MLPKSFTIQVLLLAVLVIGCAGGKVDEIVSGILGPPSVDEGATAEYNITVSGEHEYTYIWAIDPVAAGEIVNQGMPAISFQASTVESDTSVLLSVVIDTCPNPVYKSREITIIDLNNGNDPPVAAAHANVTELNPGGEVHFFDDSTDPDGDDDIVEREWDFSYDPDDGFSSESDEEDPIHIFAEEGIYHVQLRVTDASGLTDILDEPIEIDVFLGPHPPAAAAHYELFVVGEFTHVQFRDDSIDPNGNEDIVKWEWDFSFDGSDGFLVESEEREPLWVYEFADEYLVQLRVTDVDGLSDELDEPIEISILTGYQLPVAAAHFELSVPGEFTHVQFRDDSIDPNGNEDIVKWEWDFSFDGSDGFLVESEEREPLWVYEFADEYLVQLRVTDVDGLSDELDEPIEISILTGYQLPVAAAHFELSVPGGYTYAQFFDDSTDPNGDEDIIKWEWDFSYNENDGFLVDSEEWEPLQLFETVGEHLVQLRVTDSAGLSDLLDDPLVVVVEKLGIALTWGGDREDSVSGIALDVDGNVYVTGHVYNYVDFAPDSPGGEYDVGSSPRAYLSKYDVDFNYHWTQVWDWTLTIMDIAIDDSFSVYVCGWYDNYCDLDPGPGEFNPMSRHGGFISEFDLNGNFQYVDYEMSIGGLWEDNTRYTYEKLNFAPSGNINYIMEEIIEDWCWWYDDYGVHWTVCSEETNYFVRTYNTDASPWPYFKLNLPIEHIVAFDTAHNGIVCIAYKDETPTYIHHLAAISPSEYVYWQADLDCGIWIKDLAVDNDGNVYITGGFDGLCDFDPGPNEYWVESQGNNFYTDAFLAKYSTGGGFLWVKTWGAPDMHDNGYGLDLLDGRIYVTGDFKNIADFDPGPGIDEYQSTGGENGFLCIYDTDGEYQGVRVWGDLGRVWPYFVQVNDNECIFVSGIFRGTVDFDPGPEEDLHTAVDYSDCFILRLAPM